MDDDLPRSVGRSIMPLHQDDVRVALYQVIEGYERSQDEQARTGNASLVHVRASQIAMLRQIAEDPLIMGEFNKRLNERLEATAEVEKMPDVPAVAWEDILSLHFKPEGDRGDYVALWGDYRIVINLPPAKLLDIPYMTVIYARNGRSRGWVVELPILPAHWSRLRHD